MKILKRFLTGLFVLSLACASCQKPPTVVTEESPAFSGRMIVDYDGESFVQEGISVKVDFSEDGKSMDMMLNKVKFVPAMPIRIDVTIMNVPLEEAADGSVMFSADGVVPWAMGGLYDTYRVDNLSGVLKDNTISFSLEFFNTKKNEGYPTSYEGVKK